MPARDLPPPSGRLPADRLDALGLGPPPSGWVPEQPIAPPSATEPLPAAPSRSSSDPPLDVGQAVRAALVARLPLWAADRVEHTPGSTLLLLLVSLVAIAVVGVVELRHHAASASGSYPASSSYDPGAAAGAGGAPSAGTSATDPGADAQSIVVDVGGRVRKPGLVTLPLGARVADAIDAAGGPLRRRELDRIDLAQQVSDGEFLLIGVAPAAGDPAATGSGDGSGTGSTSPVSLSTATLDQLETLPGVGPVTAQKIIDWRTAHGGFSSVDQLKQVSGIGPAHFAEISPLVTP